MKRGDMAKNDFNGVCDDKYTLSSGVYQKRGEAPVVVVKNTFNHGLIIERWTHEQEQRYQGA